MNRRVKIVGLQCSAISDILMWHRRPDVLLAVPVFVGMPEDIEVLDVRNNWEARTIDVLVSHDSFPIVPDGEYPPRIAGDECRHLRIVANLRFPGSYDIQEHSAKQP